LIAGQQRAYQQLLETQLADEPRDSQWAYQSEEKIGSVVAGLPKGSSLESVSCASTICRATVRHADPTKQQELVKGIAQEEPFSNGTYYAYDGLVTTMYVSRNGTRSP
jgi:hypothetical protein